MTYQVKVESISPRMLAAVRRTVEVKNLATAFREPLDRVWAFLRQHPGLRTDGHNVFVYHHRAAAIMPVDFGVEVVRPFADEGDVACVTTPSGEAAVMVHRGPYTRLPAAHQVLREWCKSNGRTVGGHSLEIYGDWCDNPEELETTIQYLLE